MFDEKDLLPLSGLQHLLFCERRVALVHIEQIWSENTFTVEGQHLHERVDNVETESRGEIRIARGLRVRSLRLGLSCKADVVEFHHVEQAGSPGTILPGIKGQWRPFPVEYKRGTLREEEGYEIQLCAQALCIEEMLDVEVPAGAIYYGKTRRRLEVILSDKLRSATEEAASRLHEILSEGKTPRARYEKKCESCSLLDVCLPKAMSGRKSAKAYLSQAWLGIKLLCWRGTAKP